jgi:hypothetical protein
MATRVAVALALAAAVGCVAETGGDNEYGGGGDGKADGIAQLRSAETYRMLLAHVGEQPASRGVTVIGLRGLALDGRLHDTRAVKVYDDTFVVLDGDRVTELSGSTHPWELGSTHVPDVNGDGAGDVGMLRPGRFSVVARESSRDIVGAATYHVRTASGNGAVPGWRDTDHDGVVSAAERTASESRGDTLTAILFHVGGDRAPAAVGCQVFSLETHKRFVTAVGGRVSFTYVLIDANALPAELRDLL